MSNNNLSQYVLTTGTSTAYVVVNSNLGGFSGGQEFYVKIHTANTGPATFKLNNLEAKSITLNGSALEADDLAANALITLRYNDVTDTLALVFVDTLVEDSGSAGTSFSGDFGDLTGFPGDSGDVMRGDGTATPLSATDIPNHSAAKLTSGQVALAQGGTGVDLSATGGTTKFLAQDASHVVSARDLGRGDLPAQPRLEATIASGQTTVNGYITLGYATPGKNTGPGWSYSGGVWTCLIAGDWDIEAIAFVNNATSTQLYLRLNGTTLIKAGTGTNGYNGPRISTTYTFAAGDTLEFRLFCGTASLSVDVSISSLREMSMTRRA